jgi:hypothetical protein
VGQTQYGEWVKVLAGTAAALYCQMIDVWGIIALRLIQIHELAKSVHDGSSRQALQRLATTGVDVLRGRIERIYVTAIDFPSWTPWYNVKDVKSGCLTVVGSVTYCGRGMYLNDMQRRLDEAVEAVEAAKQFQIKASWWGP